MVQIGFWNWWWNRHKLGIGIALLILIIGIGFAFIFMMYPLIIKLFFIAMYFIALPSILILGYFLSQYNIYKEEIKEEDIIEDMLIKKEVLRKAHGRVRQENIIVELKDRKNGKYEVYTYTEWYSVKGIPYFDNKKIFNSLNEAEKYFEWLMKKYNLEEVEDEGEI